MGKVDKRVFEIYIAQTFWIKEKDAPTHSGKYAKCDVDFIDFRVEKGRIAEIYDMYAPVDKAVKRLETDKRFREQSRFRALNAYKGDEPIAEFDGDFIDALKFVGERWDDIRRKGGD
ncbi:MAG: hypothetical protein LBI57_03965 [Helicobacteraceae bacterium]|jgi:hypothetical protein|nr:hypothetical protein [Helicobacteraceae bacterium]